MILDAVPSALGADVFYLEVQGGFSGARAVVGGQLAAADATARIGAAASSIAQFPGASRVVEIAGIGERWGIAAAVPSRSGDGRLFVGRVSQPHEETEIVLVRAAANLVGSTLEAARLLEIAHRKDEFLAELGHELRNPLAPILTAVELLAKDGSVARERSIIERNTRHLARLVDDLLDISRVTRGNIELRRGPVQLAAVIERGLELASGPIARRRHRVEIEQAGEVTLLGDAVRLAQVFGNLLTNAAKFTPPNGRISVKVTGAGDRVRIVVADNGRGIAADQLERIFEPFVQGDRERDALSGGLGLGLAIVRSLVERHDGSITAASAGPGLGSTFTVELPRADGHVVAAVEPPRAEPPSRGGMRVLVVDDNDDVATLLSEALELEGYTTAIAHDASAALEVGRSFEPHAAVLDVGLPGVDGYELATEIRARHGRGIALIAATGYGQPRDRARAEAAGFARHLTKPVSIAELVHALDHELGLRPTPP